MSESGKGLEEISQQIASCQKCPLSKTATNPVPGNGDFQAEIMFIGEAPGYWEDQKGIPFCGRSGKLLDELLFSINLDRSKVFIANVLKHRPPDNRDPLPEEIEACRQYLDDQLKIIKPKTIVSLGRFAMTKFYPSGKISIDHGKGRIVEYNQSQYILIPLYHPAAALRGAGVEKTLRRDFENIPHEIQRLKDLMNKELKISSGQTEEKTLEEQLLLV